MSVMEVHEVDGIEFTETGPRWNRIVTCLTCGQKIDGDGDSTEQQLMAAHAAEEHTDSAECNDCGRIFYKAEMVQEQRVLNIGGTEQVWRGYWLCDVCESKRWER